jgi:hypothetical protein
VRAILTILRLYNSKVAIRADRDPSKYKDVPLILWNEPGGTHPEGRKEDNCRFIPQVNGVSDGDAAGVKQIYPWKMGPQ